MQWLPTNTTVNLNINYFLCSCQKNKSDLDISKHNCRLHKSIFSTVEYHKYDGKPENIINWTQLPSRISVPWQITFAVNFYATRTLSVWILTTCRFIVFPAKLGEYTALIDGNKWLKNEKKIVYKVYIYI